MGTGVIGLSAFLALLWVTYRNYREAETVLRHAGDEAGAHLAGAYKLAFVSILLYFMVKSGIDHKIFILAVPASEAVRRYALRRARAALDAKDAH